MINNELVVQKPDLLFESINDYNLKEETKVKLGCIMKQYDQAVKAKLYGQIERIKDRAIAVFLEDFGFSYLCFQWSTDSLYRFSTYTGIKEGIVYLLRSLKGSSIKFDRIKLKDYDGFIPEDIINKIPVNAGDKKVYVFREKYGPDPIIAIKISYNKYIGLWKWF